MSHESGFRQGGRDFSHKRESFKRQKERAERFEQRMAKRFHEHEKAAVEEAPAEASDSEKPGEG